MNKKAHWNQVYQYKSPDALSWYQTTPDRSLQMIEAGDRGMAGRVIDVGGGASVLVDHLLEAGYQGIAVLDISAEGLRHARNRLGSRADQVEWHEADVTYFVPPRVFDVWHDRAVFHFLTHPDDRKRYKKTLLETLRPGGSLVLATFAVGGPERCSGLEIVQYDQRRILDQFGDVFDLVDTCHEDHRTPGGVVQRFAYFHLVREA